MACGAAAVAGLTRSALLVPAFAGVSEEPDVFSLHENLWPGGRCYWIHIPL